MKPGRELDALIAEKVMGLPSTIQIRIDPAYPAKGWSFDSGAPMPTPSYSTDIAAAWQVVEKLKELSRDILPADKEIDSDLRHALHSDGIRIQFCRVNKKWKVCWWESGIYEADSESIVCEADTAPHAICLAALKVMEKT